MILLADDDQLVLNVMHGILTHFGFEVLIAHDGEEALRCYEEHAHTIDLLLFDQRMPKMRGEEVVRIIRARARYPVPAILISGTRLADSDIYFAQGKDLVFVNKPFSVPVLVDLVKDLVASRSPL